MIEQTLAEEISKREFQVTNRDKMIKYLQEEHKKRGEEILSLKDKLHRRNMQIKELKKKLDNIPSIPCARCRYIIEFKSEIKDLKKKLEAYRIVDEKNKEHILHQDNTLLYLQEIEAKYIKTFNR